MTVAGHHITPCWLVALMSRNMSGLEPELAKGCGGQSGIAESAAPASTTDTYRDGFNVLIQALNMLPLENQQERHLRLRDRRLAQREAK